MVVHCGDPKTDEKPHFHADMGVIDEAGQDIDATAFSPRLPTVPEMPGRFSTRSELFAALEIHTRYLTSPAALVTELFPYAVPMGSELCLGNFVVSTAVHFHQLYGQMVPGQWAGTIQRMGIQPWIEAGYDLFSLFTSLYNASIPGVLERNFAIQSGGSIPYRAPIGPKEAFAILSEAMGLVYADAEEQPSSLKGWRKIRSPLSPVADLPPRIQPQIPGVQHEWRQYRNRTGATTSFVFYYELSDGLKVPVYVSLLKNAKSVQHQWLPIFPEKPFLLFNGDRILSSPESEVVFCQDERQAEAVPDTQSIGTTVPGGMRNFLDADLTGLRRRKVVLHLEIEDLKRGRLFREKLRQSGVANPEFCLLKQEGDGYAKRHSFDELELVAAENSAPLSVPTSDKKVASIRPIVSRPGETLPGGNVVPCSLIDPIIHEGDLVWLYAEPKVGKTWLALALAHAVAAENGELGKWSSPHKWRVLYVDGEMKPGALQRRIDKISKGAGISEKGLNFAVLCAKAQDQGFIRIDTEEWQQAIEQQLEGIHLLILDNFQSLTDNAVNTMMQLRSWLHHITSNKVAVLVIDHTNRDGDLQGSLAKARNADLCIAMSVAEDVPAGEIIAGEEGEVARILVEFPLGARELHGEQIAPFMLERRISDVNGLTFGLLDKGMVPDEELINHKKRAQINRGAAVFVLRDRETPMTYEDMRDALGWSVGVLNKDAGNRNELGERETRYFEKCEAKFRKLDAQGVPPERWGVERSTRGSDFDG